jgi:NAD(P)-dependent dehydrogenase (short-subunit alcohol dehydrogenase family)
LSAASSSAAVPAPPPSWGPDDIVDLTGKTVLITGANSGIGFEAALELAAHGALTVLACRDPERGRLACSRIMTHVPVSSVELLTVDLSDQASVHAAADTFSRRYDRLDVLVNNAGVMGPPYRQTADGFELQLATNHLGPFALTGLLLGYLLTTNGSRVVTVSSNLHKVGRIHWDDLQSERRYSPQGAYSQTKLANLLFTFELERRLRAAGSGTIAVAAHPGWARTRLAANGPTIGATGLRRRAAVLSSRLGQAAITGALPLLYAATARDVVGGAYYGPRGVGELFGPAAVAKVTRRAAKPADGARLFDLSEQLTGVHYDFGEAASATQPGHAGEERAPRATSSQ